MTGFALIIWIVLTWWIERALCLRIKTLEKEIAKLKGERRVVLADSIERLEWIEMPLPAGCHMIDYDGVHENPTINVLTCKSRVKNG